jgi:hypothetical protein
MLVNKDRVHLMTKSQVFALCAQRCLPNLLQLLRSTLQQKSHLCFWELRGLSLHIHVSVSDLDIPRIGPRISCSRIGRSILGI